MVLVYLVYRPRSCFSAPLAPLEAPSGLHPRLLVLYFASVWPDKRGASSCKTHRIHGAAIYGNIYHQYTPNVSIYTIHGSYGVRNIWRWFSDGFLWRLGWGLRFVQQFWSDEVSKTSGVRVEFRLSVNCVWCRYNQIRLQMMLQYLGNEWGY